MPLPGNVTAITVTGKYINTDGTPSSGSVSFEPSGKVWRRDPGAGTILVSKKTTVTLDVVTGAFSVILPATDDPDATPTGTTYDVIETINGEIRPSFAISLPSTPTTADISALAPVVASGSVSLAVTKINGLLPNSGGEVTLTPGAIGAPTTTDLTNGLAGKADLGHTHPQSDITNLVSDLAGKATKYAQVPLTDPAGGTITLDAATGRDFRVTLGGNRVLAAPTGGTPGLMLMLEVKQDTTGGRTLTPGTNVVLGDDVSTLSLTATPGKTDLVLLRANSDATKWMIVAVIHGYTV